MTDTKKKQQQQQRNRQKRHYIVDLPSRTKFKKLKKEQFFAMVSKSGVSKLIIVFKIAFVKLIKSTILK